MHDDLVGEHYSTTKEMWDQLRLKYGGTITTRFRALTLRFNQYIMVPKHTMVEHLTVISTMVRKMKEIGYDLIYEQHVLIVIRLFPESSCGQVNWPLPTTRP